MGILRLNMSQSGLQKLLRPIQRSLFKLQSYETEATGMHYYVSKKNNEIAASKELGNMESFLLFF